MFSNNSLLRQKFQRFCHLLSVMLAILIFSTYNLSAIADEISPAPDEIKPPTINTIQANAQVYEEVPIRNQEDWALATRGYIDKRSDPYIYLDGTKVAVPVWDLKQYEFLLTKKNGSVAEIPSPDPRELPRSPFTVNPSLWRNAQLNMQHGLYKVTPDPDDVDIPGDIYQLRGYDLSVMTLVKGETGWIVIDPLTSMETAKAGLILAHDSFAEIDGFEPHLIDDGNGKLPVSAVIYTHSHIDHFGGVKGVVDENNVAEIGDNNPSTPTNVHIYAPEGFLEEAVSENVMAGNVMSRRASYMYGNLISKNETGQVDGGLGKTTSSGTPTLIPPTDIIDSSIETTGTIQNPQEIDGVKIVFQNAPGSEAPAEMLFYFPDLKALCASEDATHTMHNLYTLRGAKVRDSLGWTKYLNETIELFGDDVEVVFASHHWPTWGNAEIVDYLKKQRDLYKYIHDQTLHYANQGYTMLEIAEMLKLPPSLAEEWYNRGYYGSLSHNVKAVYQRYLGWFDGNPANLHELPPEEAGKKYIEYMLAGVNNLDGLVAKAQEDYDDGQYRWVAKAMSHAIFGHCNSVDPAFSYGITTSGCEAARNLEADALEQLGYQAESGPWRNFYLTGALELRHPIDPDQPVVVTGSPDIVASMTPEMFFDYMALSLNGYNAAVDGLNSSFNMIFPDINEQYALYLENGVLNYTKDKLEPTADVIIYIDRAALSDLILHRGQPGFTPDYEYSGDIEAFQEFLDYLESFEFWFGVVTP